MEARAYSKFCGKRFENVIWHRYLGNYCAQLLVANSLGVSGPTVKRYLHFLEGAFLVKVLEPWFVNTTKRLVKSPKVYVRDPGLLHAMLGIQNNQTLLGHPVAGTSWEGFVVEQIIQVLPENIRPFFYRTHQGAEADVVLVKGIEPVAAIEIKLTNSPTISKGFHQTLEDLKLRKGYVITPGSDTYSVQHKDSSKVLNDFAGTSTDLILFRSLSSFDFRNHDHHRSKRLLPGNIRHRLF
jgi:predicted AAA+ superfamily ATPase